MSKLTLVTDGETQILIKRRFAAPPEAIYRAHVEKDLVQKWLLGPPGWTMPNCEIDPRPGGKFRYDWADGKGNGFYIAGEFVELIPFSKIVHVERMFLPAPTPANTIETSFAADGANTLMTMRMTLPNAEARAQMLASGFDKGMEGSFARLETEILKSA